MYEYPDYLAHYGVLGMKWGIHRASKYATKASEERRKGNTAKANKYMAKSKKIESYHKSMGGTKTYNRVKSQSTAKLYGKSLVLGTYGALNYEQARSAGVTRGKAFLHGAGRGILDSMSSGILSVVEPRMDKGSNKNK